MRAWWRGDWRDEQPAAGHAGALVLPFPGRQAA
jgi:hypothetical protein